MHDVLVFGGTSPAGIGKAVCDRIHFLGHRAVAPLPEDCDVTGTDEVLDRCLEAFGRPEFVVYSVGYNELDWMHNLESDTFETLMAVNVWGFINVLKALQRTGMAYNVVAITSDAAVRPMRTSMAYCASKAALNQVIRVASRELAAEGWRINGVAPGKVEGTAMTRYVDKRVLEIRGWDKAQADAYELASSPMNRALYPMEVATVVCDVLFSDAVGWTGDIISVNGGR